MKRLFKAALTMALALPVLAVLAFSPAPAQAAPVNVLIMGEDADLDTVPRNSRVFNRVVQALAAELSRAGFRVYDETAATMDVTNPARVRRTDAELLTVAKRVPNVPIDMVVVFQIYASAEQNVYAPDIIDLRIRVSGRIVHVQSGRAVENFEVSYGPGELPSLPQGCNRDCVLEHVGEESRRIAADVGDVLATMLSSMTGTQPQQPATATGTVATQPTVVVPSPGCGGMLTTAYTLEFRGFESEEISRIEEYLVVFKGYDHHRPVRVMRTSAEYWYETCSDLARLNRNLRLMTERMGVEARISLVGNKFEIDKIGIAN